METSQRQPFPASGMWDGLADGLQSSLLDGFYHAHTAYKAHYRACVVAGNLYVISLDYCICGWGGEATPKLRFPEWFVGVYVF